LVGNGPSVSEFVTEHPVAEDPELEVLEEDVLAVSSSLPQWINIGAAMAVTPAKPKLFKNPFLFIVFIICGFKIKKLKDNPVS
jgi:hypothetical protein